MKLKNRLSIILASCMLIMSAALPTYADEPWKGWSMAASSVKNEDGTATVSDKSGSATSMIKYQSFSDSFEVEFSMKVDSFSTETGIQIITGKYRMYMNFGENQITYFTGDGKTNVKAVLGYNIGKQMHDYRFAVNGNRANVFIDDNFAGSIIIQTKSDSSPRIQYWVKGTSSKVATLTGTVVKYKSTAVAKEVPYDERKEIQLDMTNPDAFDVATEGGTVWDKDGFARMNADAPGTAYYLRKYAGIDRDFDYEFRYRLVSSYGESGAQIIWNGHRVMIYFYPDYCRVLTKDGQYRYSYGRSVLGEWHDYRVEVRGDFATLYMDGKLMSTYELVNWTSDRPYFGFWLNRKDRYYNTTMDIDNIHLVPYTYSEKLEMPIDGSKYVAGSDIALKAGKTEADEVVYYANGTEIGKAGKNDSYKLIWNAPAGEYQITAKASDGKTYDVANISVVPPVKATVTLPETAVFGSTVEAKISGGSVFDKIIRTELYVGGKLYSKKDGYAEAIAIDGLGVGTHNVFVKCILENGLESVSESRQIRVESTSLDVTVPKNAEVSFTAEGIGKATLNIADGRYGKAFDITEAGDYKIVTDSGVFYVYRNGKMETSGRMDTAWENRVSVTEEGILVKGIKLIGAEDVFAYLDILPENGKTYELYDIPQEYSVEFKANESKGSLAMYDGSYALKLSITEDGISARTSIGGIGDESDTLIYKDFKPGVNYQVQVSRGIAQLFENNSFVASFRIVEEYAFASNIKTENISEITVKNMKNSFTMVENFDSDLDLWNMKGNGWQQEQNGAGGYLKSDSGDKRPLLAYGFSKNPEIELDAKVEGQPGSGGIYVTARNNTDYAYMYAGYDFKAQSYVVREVYSNEVKTVFSSNGAFEDGRIKAVFNDNKLELYVNGKQKISTDKVTYIGFGRFGVIADGVVATVDNFSYKGEGNVTPGIYDVTLPDIMNMELTTLADGSLMYLGAYGKNHRSYDNGFTWAQESALPHSTTTKAGNIIKLKSGKYLMMTRCQTGTDKYITQMFLSPDGVSNWEGPYNVEKEAVARVCMNGKLDQMADGRIFYVSVSLAEGIEEHGIFVVYYSDDEGKTWKASESEFNSFKNFRNLQENKIVGMKEKGHVRLYGRTEYGFIYYCDSYDNGVTWEPEFHASQLAAPMNAFNIRYDSYSDKYYAFWTYDNKNDYGNKQYPRLRVALAVSSDNQKTWDYIMDVDEFEYNTTNFNRFQNLSVDFTKDAIYVNFIRNAPTASSSNAITSRVVRIDRDKIKTMGRFPYLHIRRETQVPKVIKDLENKSLYTKEGSNTCVINGYRYQFAKPVYRNNSILAEAVSVYLGYNPGNGEYVGVDSLPYNKSVIDGAFILTKSETERDMKAMADYLKFAIPME